MMNAINPLKRFAFFDVDDTLISVKSMLSFQDYWYQQYPSPAAERAYRVDLATHLHPNACWAELNRLYYSHFKGRSHQQLLDAAEGWYHKVREQEAHFYHPNVVARLQQHQARGETPVFVSGSFTQLLKPIAIELKVKTVLAINLIMENGICTGDIDSPQTIGEGKAEAVRQFLQEQQSHSAACFAYGDDISDLPMLKLVGTATVVAGGRRLTDEAHNRGWEVLQP